MPSEQNRVYIENEDEAPDDALIRESDNGNLYYTPEDRGRNNHTGGNKTNELLQQSGPELTPKADEEESEDDDVDKSFEGPAGHGPFDSLEDCTERMEGQVDEPEEWCKWAENKSAEGTFGKPFEGPQGQGPFDSFDDCVSSMEDEEGIDDPEGWCAWAERKARKQEQASKIYVGSAEEAPDDVTIKEDDHGLFYRQLTAWESGDLHYPEDIEDDVMVDLPESESATEDGVESEEEEDEEQEDLHEESHELFENP